jgi:hypothetical protein
VKEKGPLTLRERPKSREETPKEGDDDERRLSRYRTATTYTASHKTQVLLTYFTWTFPVNLLHFVQGRSSAGHGRFRPHGRIWPKISFNQYLGSSLPA